MNRIKEILMNLFLTKNVYLVLLIVAIVSLAVFAGFGGFGGFKVDTFVKEAQATVTSFWNSTATKVTNAPATETPTVDNTEYVVSVDNLNVRSAPMVSAGKIGQLHKGDKFQIVSTEQDSSGNVWGKIADEEYVALKYNNSYLTTWKE